MSDEPRSRCGDVDEPNPADDRPTDRWIAGDAALDAELPPALQSALGRFLGTGPVETVGEWAAEIRRRVDGDAVGVADLCLTDEETEHWGTVGGERHHFACFYDAVILAALSDRPVEIRTESPDGTVIEARAVGGERHHFACFYDAVILAALSDRPVEIRTESPDGTVIEARAVGGTELTATPEGAVFSFGIERGVEPPSEGGPTLERGYAAVCPYVKAFPNRDAHERWAADVPAATVAMPLAGATGLAAALAGESS